MNRGGWQQTGVDPKRLLWSWYYELIRTRADYDEYADGGHSLRQRSEIACQIARWHLGEARRTLGLIGDSDTFEGARALLTSLSHKPAGVSPRDISRTAPMRVRKKERRVRALGTLVEHGLARLKTGPDGDVMCLLPNQLPAPPESAAAYALGVAVLSQPDAMPSQGRKRHNARRFWRLARQSQCRNCCRSQCRNCCRMGRGERHCRQSGLANRLPHPLPTQNTLDGREPCLTALDRWSKVTCFPGFRVSLLGRGEYGDTT